MWYARYIKGSDNFSMGEFVLLRHGKVTQMSVVVSEFQVGQLGGYISSADLSQILSSGIRKHSSKFFWYWNREFREENKRKKTVVLEGVKEKIKEIIKNLRTKFKLEKTFFDSKEELAIELVQEEQEQVDPEEHALVIVLSLLSLTCGERKYLLYWNLIREKFWVNQKELKQSIREYKQKIQTYGLY